MKPVGLVIELWNSEVCIVAIEPGSAADAAGRLQIGDVLLSVDGLPVFTVEAAQRLLRGRPGKSAHFPDYPDPEPGGLIKLQTPSDRLTAAQLDSA